MANEIKFLGNTDEVDTCDCCGKKNLKSTVALSIDDADPVYYGVVCAARALKMSAKDVRSESRKADDEKRRLENAAREAAFRAEFEPWAAFCAANGRGADLFTQIQSLGGYKAARALYESGRAAA